MPLENVEWALADYLPPSTYIIDKSIVFEGYRKTGEEGYKITLRSASEQEIRARTELFDSLFESAEQPSIGVLCARLDEAGREEALVEAPVVPLLPTNRHVQHR